MVTSRTLVRGLKVSKPYRYARKVDTNYIPLCSHREFQNLIGMLGRILRINKALWELIVSKPYRYARKALYAELGVVPKEFQNLIGMLGSRREKLIRHLEMIGFKTL